MTAALDVKDKKILFELDFDARQTNQEIARKTGVSKQVAGFRIKRLEASKLLTTYYTIIDIAKLGRAAHKNFVRLQNITPEKEKEFHSYLHAHPNIVWFASCDGRFDFVFSIWAKDVVEIDETLKEINSKFGHHIAERQIATILRGEYFTRDYLLGKKERTQRTRSVFGGVPQPVDIDKTHWQILHLLGENARRTAVTIAEQTGVSADAVADRIRKLEQAGVIRHYNIVPNEAAYPYLHYKVLVSFRMLTDAEEKSLQEYCQRNAHIVYTAKTLGPWDFEMDIEVASVDEFRVLLMDFKTQFQENIKDYSTLLVYQVHKYNFCPSIPSEIR